MKKLNRLMRCRRTKRHRRIAWKLIQALYRVSRAFSGRDVILYSGYRNRRVARLPHSYHIRGMAVDFRIAGVSTRRLRDHLLASFRKGGIGYYPKRPFVHFDVRERRAFWIDLSDAGEPGRYAADPYGLLAAEKVGLSIAEDALASQQAVDHIATIDPIPEIGGS